MPKSRDVMDLDTLHLDTLLARAVELGASDIHLKLGRPPMLRRDGSLGPMENAPDLSEDDLDGFLQRVTKVKPERYAQFQETGDLDIAYQSGDLPRFRVNGLPPARQRVVRLPRDPEEGSDDGAAADAAGRSTPRERASRPRARDRRDGLW